MRQLIRSWLETFAIQHDQYSKDIVHIPYGPGTYFGILMHFRVSEDGNHRDRGSRTQTLEIQRTLHWCPFRPQSWDIFTAKDYCGG
jgi:hypothetical protein